MKLRSLAAAVVVAVEGSSALLAFSGAGGEEHEEQEEGWGARLAGPAGVRPVDDPLYAAECGSCHYAYPPGLLPAESWRGFMSNLAEHFGENAELEPGTQQQLTDYLVRNAAERDTGWIARGISRSVETRTGTVKRITETPYFVRQHDEIPPRVWRDKPDVGSLSNCSACHTAADKGRFDEHSVKIPGVGRWDD